MKTFFIPFPSLEIECVGSDENIDHIIKMLDHHQDKIINMDMLINEIISRHISAIAFSEEQNPKDIEVAAAINKKLDKFHLLITIEDFMEAALYYKPLEMARCLNLSNDELQYRLENNKWRGWYQ